MTDQDNLRDRIAEVVHDENERLRSENGTRYTPLRYDELPDIHRENRESIAQAIIDEFERTGVFTKPESPYLHKWAKAKAREDEYTPTVQSLIDHYRELSTTVSGDETVGEQNAEIAHRVITTTIVDAIREYANRLTQPGSTTTESEDTP